MALQYERNLRGKDLARQVLDLNGHQQSPKFIFFQPMWIFMIMSLALSGLVPVLKYVGLAGMLGVVFEAAIWLWYWITTKRISAYPGLSAWFSIQLRRRLMALGRSAGLLSRPRG